MPLLRQSIYAQNVNLYLAPTADGRETWLPLMQTVAFESRAVVLSCNQCLRKSQLPAWVKRTTSSHTQDDADEVAVRESSSEPAGTSGETVNGSGSPTLTKCRRRSVITEDQHEITWPDHKLPSSSVTLKHTSRSLPPAPISETDSDPYVTGGGSCIISPFGQVLAGPVWNATEEDEEGLQVLEVDFEDCIRGRLDLDLAGSYARNDAFKLTVEGLDLDPPPF
jgi:nitrilase